MPKIYVESAAVLKIHRRRNAILVYGKPEIELNESHCLYDERNDTTYTITGFPLITRLERREGYLDIEILPEPDFLVNITRKETRFKKEKELTDLLKDTHLTIK